MISGPPPVPAIVQPAAYEVSYGLVTGWVAKGTRRIVIRVGRRQLADRRVAGRHFTVRVDLPPRELTLSVTAVGAGGLPSTSRVEHVVGLPQAANPKARGPHQDVVLAGRLRGLVAGYPGTCAVYVEDLTDGSGAAWNARARFPAASTLKLAIAVTALAEDDDPPGPGTVTDSLLRRMLDDSDNDAANDLEVRVAGSTSAGGRRVDELMEELGLTDTLMYGGYERDLAATGDPIPLRVEDQPSFGRGKYTSARDLAGLLRAIWLASRGLGPLHPREPLFTAGDARHLLYLLAHARGRGKLDREIGAVPGVQVLHKAGWIGAVRHDNGLVFWRGGVFLATVMTYRAGGAGVSSDILAGRAASLALSRFSGERGARRRLSRSRYAFRSY